MPQIIDGKIYIAPDIILINKETKKPMTEKEYSEYLKKRK